MCHSHEEFTELVECLLDGPACASHADRGVARRVCRPVIRYCSALNYRPVIFFIQLRLRLWEGSLFSRYSPDKGEAKHQE